MGANLAPFVLAFSLVKKSPAHSFAAVGVLVILLVLGPTARWLDRQTTDEPLRNLWGELRWREDWSSAAKLPLDLRRDWLEVEQSNAPIRIAHALGGAGTEEINSLSSFHKARLEGVQLFEVDLWLDEQMQLRCFHGSKEQPTPKNSLVGPNDCTLQRLLEEMKSVRGWLILDIKSDFARTGESVVALLKSTGLADRIVFQLYHPEHVALFSKWSSQLPLQTPIITAYASHRGVQHIADQMNRIGASAMALPINARENLTRRPAAVILMLHPVHSCAEWLQSRVWGADGVFIANGLDCVR